MPYRLFSSLSLTAFMKSSVPAVFTSLRVVISAKSFVIMPLSTVSITAFSSLPAKAARSLRPSSSPLFLRAPLQAKIVAMELVEVGSPSRYL